MPCSCESGIVRSAIGMLGKVWSSGALAVVQNVAIIPTSVHPRNKLDGVLPSCAAAYHAVVCRLPYATQRSSADFYGQPSMREALMMCPPDSGC